jgi:hypothetical protein
MRLFKDEPEEREHEDLKEVIDWKEYARWRAWEVAMKIRSFIEWCAEDIRRRTTT